MSRFLVTGGAGFLGSHLIDVLHEDGHEVISFDLSRPQQNCKFFLADLTKLGDVIEATENIDIVCHLGGVGDVYLAFEKPHVAAAANVLGTANLMEACLKNKVKRVVYTSTWEVYGSPMYEPMDEEHPCKPDHPYSITKLAGEQIALSYDRLKGIEVTALRLGTAYGERMRPTSVFSVFVTRALKGEPIIIKGSGQQFRQFTHAKSIAHAFALAANSPMHGEVFNIVSEETVSIKRLAELIVERIPTPIIHSEPRHGDIHSAPVSAEKARRKLGWTHTIPFSTGLSELIDWHISGHSSGTKQPRSLL